MKRSPQAPIRVLLAKVGLDGHDRGIKIVARALRDAGVEVIYLGIHNTPEEIVNSAVQEDVAAVGLSIHSAAHLTHFEEVLRLLKERKAANVAVFGGGIIPQDDIPGLLTRGVRALFGPGTPMEEIVAFVKGGFRIKAKGKRKKYEGEEKTGAARLPRSDKNGSAAREH